MISEKILRSLSYRKYRQRYGKFLVEGPDIIEHFLKSGYPISMLVIDRKFKEKYREITYHAGHNRIEIKYIPGGKLKKISTTVTTQGIIALADIKPERINDGGPCVFLDGVQDPGNVGAVVRTAVAAGFKSVIGGKGTADFYNPKVVRSSAGGLASIHCVQDEDPTLLHGLKQKGYTVFVTDCSRGKDYRRVTYPEKTVLVMGNEGEGVSAQAAGTGDHLINIPLKQKMKSLNIAVAFGILAYEIQKRSTT